MKEPFLFVYGKDIHCFNICFCSVDIDAEEIELRFAGDCSVEEIASKTPEDHPCYTFFLFKHTHEGDYIESIGKCLDFNGPPGRSL